MKEWRGLFGVRALFFVDFFLDFEFSIKSTSTFVM